MTGAKRPLGYTLGALNTVVPHAVPTGRARNLLPIFPKSSAGGGIDHGRSQRVPGWDPPTGARRPARLRDAARAVGLARWSECAMTSATNTVSIAPDAAAGDTPAAAAFDLTWEPSVPGRRRVLANWNDYLAWRARSSAAFTASSASATSTTCIRRACRRERRADWRGPTRSASPTPNGARRDAPVVVCCGGVANVAMRFNYLAADLNDVVPRDLHGLGRPRPVRAGWPPKATTRSPPTPSSCGR